MKLTQQYLAECFSYDQETGVLTWRERPRHHFQTDAAWAHSLRNQSGRPAGWAHDQGYLRISLAGRFYYAHRVIWCLMAGEWPATVDHRDGDRRNNRWGNLRAATTSQNRANCGPRRHNKLGVKGVRQRPDGKFEARIRHDGTERWLGSFERVEQAAQAFAAAHHERHGDFSRVSAFGSAS